ncbi:FAD-binding oxidoreductase [Aquibium sp. A9E412]|uniref:NAD(P)/FAD-dependent oxidoreductase n=1 Tax=Aquibium sp. A9E412 TaxID=2976767 RepID=UPI0025B15B8E|nr:FAD-binding oxidoreductase [Aquibium sp. A9E412]MDN2565423.1 FAD-binding oxidoreductase [Aquibium sp. A9E412]
MPAGARESCDIAVIGAGIAGASLASELAATHRVVLVEREPQPGYHTTGRSAALFSTTYGPPVIRAMSRASAGFFEAPPQAFAEHALLGPRGMLMIARADQAEALEAAHAALAEHGTVERLTGEAARQRAPLLRAGYAAGAIAEAGARDIDVHALHQGYLRRFRRAGGRLVTDAELVALAPEGGRWRVDTRAGTVLADAVVNAAGAWADAVAQMAGAAPVGLVPKRRTALIVAAPEGARPAGWPMVVDVAEEFYMKPDAGRLLVSPADETPSPPCDAQPEELDVAICVDRIERAFDIAVRRIENKWAGLRSFVADKGPVVGYAPERPGFFWLAGQGGYGIQSAPAMARAAAALVRGEALPADIADQGVTPAALAPARLAQAA